MQPRRSEFLPDPSLSRAEMESLQRAIAAEAIFPEKSPTALSEESLTVAGVDQAFTDDRATSAVVLLQDGSEIERVHASAPTEIPYIPGLLSFREGGSILAAFEKLDREPDVVLFDGSGRIHFREAGLATHIGVVLDLPAVGVTKRLLCGDPAESLAEPLSVGTRVPILANEDVTAPDGTTIGFAVQTRQYDTGDRSINPLYVSPGHRVSAETAASLVQGACAGYKLPEPIRRADRYVGELTA